MIGRIVEITTYPVKSMAGLSAESAHLGFHGLDGDRRFAFRRTNDVTGFPFLTAGRFPDLVTYRPIGAVPTHVRTPRGAELELRSDELRREISSRSGHDVELMTFRNGIFDDGQVSVMSLATLEAIGREAGMEIDRRRMRANILLDTDSSEPFQEDAWVGGMMLLGDGADAPALSITSRDERCAMVNFDPDTGAQDPRVMKAVVRMNGNYAGVYATAIRAGRLGVGQSVRLTRS